MSNRSTALRCAGVAYVAALEQDWDKATAAIQRINDECGPQFVPAAMLAWIDTYIDHATDGDFTLAREVPERTNYVNTRTGHLDEATAEGLPAEVVWAGSLIAARARMNRDRFDALLRELQGDGKQRGRYVGALLESIALTVNTLPRGFVKMGLGLS